MKKTLVPFWNKTTLDLSRCLWTPTIINCNPIESNLDLHKSWFSMLSQSQRSHFCNKNYVIPKLSTDIKIAKLKTRKIRLFPTKAEKTILLQWFGIDRYIYNKGLAIIDKKEYFYDTSLKKYLRAVCVADANYETENTWVLDVGYDNRDFAITELLEKYFTGIKTYNETKKPFTLSYKTKKKSQSISIRKKDYNAKTDRSKFRFLSGIKKAEIVPVLAHDIKIHKNKSGKFYMLVPMDVIRERKPSSDRIISLDPGARTFLTGYSPDGVIYHIGKNDVERICRLNFFKRKLQGKIKAIQAHNRYNTERKQTYKLRKAYNRFSFKIRNLVDDAHKKIVKWLLATFKTIILPKLDTNSFCKKKMYKPSKNKIKAWRHCAFIDKLKFKWNEYPDRQVIIPTEEYTSMTCSECGTLNRQLGDSKIFICLNCDSVFDRDVNAGKNILLKTVCST